MDDILARMAQNLFGWVDGSLAMRLIIQPIMAAVFATRDEINDARQGRPPCGGSLPADPKHRGHRLKGGRRSICRVLVAPLVLDVVCQIIELRLVHIGEALIMAEALVLAPSVILRGPINPISSRNRRRIASCRI